MTHRGGGGSCDCAQDDSPGCDGARSKRPIGPFQKTVAAFAICAANAATVAGPMSSAIAPGGIASTDTVRPSTASSLSPTTTSVGSSSVTRRPLAFSRIVRASASLSVRSMTA